MSTTASLHFLDRLPLYETEKPYVIQFWPHGDVPRSNVKQSIRPAVQITDIRPIKDELTLDTHGFVVRQLDTALNPHDFGDPERVEHVYLREIQELLSRVFKTTNIAVVEYLVRRRHQSFPISTGEEFDYAQPVATAHIDFSPDCLVEMIQDRYGHRAEELLMHRYQLVNIWKPLYGPLYDWPLALCKPSSLDPQRDLQTIDRVYPKNVEESIQIHYSDEQEWCYLEGQQANELLIFRGGDSAAGLHSGVPHCSFEPQDEKSKVSRPRESIEVRALVFDCEDKLDLDSVASSRRHGPKSAY